jgi:hypothetical protein
MGLQRAVTTQFHYEISKNVMCENPFMFSPHFIRIARVYNPVKYASIKFSVIRQNLICAIDLNRARFLSVMEREEKLLQLFVRGDHLQKTDIKLHRKNALLEIVHSFYLARSSEMQLRSQCNADSV